MTSVSVVKPSLTDYPIFSEWAWFFYTIMFPAIVAISEAYLIYFEFKNRSSGSYNTLYDLIIAAGVLVSLGLYRGAPAIRCCWRKLKNVRNGSAPNSSSQTD